jgi:hypothetical protein
VIHFPVVVCTSLKYEALSRELDAMDGHRLVQTDKDQVRLKSKQLQFNVLRDVTTNTDIYEKGDVPASRSPMARVVMS